MAMIEKIRNQRGLLLVILGIGMLGFLVPFDAVIALTGQGAARDVGSVNGTSISGQDYQIAVQNRRSLGFTGDGLTNEVWNDMTTDIGLEDEFSNAVRNDCKQAGIIDTPENLWNFFIEKSRDRFC